jgi:purine-nucleoside phosphorylase
MPGDPLRAKFIAENFLTGAKCFNTVRGMLGYTGEYNGYRLSVLGSGMGIPSMGIYSYELYKFYGVETIIRIGTAGAISDNLKLRDLVLAVSASTDSNYVNQFGIDGTFAPTADFKLLQKATREADKLGIKYFAGNILTSDRFYNKDTEALVKWGGLGVLAVEMECAALYTNAASLGKKALGILTISDHVFTGETTTSDERLSAFTDMMKVALNTAAEESADV